MKNPKQIFRKLWKQNNLTISDMNPADIGCLQLMLIGCKPAINNNQLALNTKNILLDYGYISSGKWIYDPEQIDELSSKYPNIFKKNIYNCFQKPIEKLDDMRTGLLLGIPFKAAQKFDKLSNKKSNTISKILVSYFRHRNLNFS